MAKRQHGLVSRAQLLGTGMHPDAIWRRLRNGEWEEALPNVYRVSGAPVTWLQSLMAACLWGGEDAVASHRAASALWGLDGFEEGPLERTAGKKHQLGVRFRVHQPPVPPHLTTVRRGVPVTNAFRTMWDLAPVLIPDRREQVFDEMLRKGLISLPSMRRVADRGSGQGRRGVTVMRQLLNERDPDYQPSASELQRRVRNLLTGAGIDFGVRHHRRGRQVRCPRGLPD